MARLHPARLVFSLLLGAAACSTLPESCPGKTIKQDLGTEPGGKTDVGGEVVIEPAAHRRHVALMEAGVPCAQVDDWDQARLFHLTTDAAAEWSALKELGTMPAPLERFCVYTWTGAGDPPAQPTVPGSIRVDPDPDIVVPQSPATLTLGPARSEAVMRALGGFPGSAPALSPYVGEGPVAYVAVVDTADSQGPGTAIPSYSAAAPRQQHGLMMGSLIQELRCPHDQARCTSRQFFAQAFPYDATTVQPLASGGQRGSVGSLASAIGEAVARWKRVRPADDTSPLVINMSLGWDVQHGATLPGSHEDLLDVAAPDPGVPASVLAVHHALAWAACEGALSVAASGNARGALCEQEQTIAPATWETLPAPNAAACARFGITLASGQSVAKLVYGVGGLDESDHPIANTRQQSMPSRGLFAHQTSVSIGGTHTDPWTGTSLASAAFSAIAAQVWSHGSGQPAAAVIQTLDAAGVAVPLDHHWQGPAAATPSSILRIDAHTVMQAVDPPNNPYAGRSTPSRAIPKAAVNHASARLQSIANTDPVTLVATTPSTGTCDGVTLQTFATADSRGGSSANGLPSSSHNSDELRPQPHVPICPNCPVSKKKKPASGAPLSPPIQYTFFIEIDARYANSTVDLPVLSFFDPASNTTLSVALGSIDLSGATSVLLHNYTLPSGGTVADWLDARAQVISGRLSLQVDEDGTGPMAAQVATQVVDVVR